MENLSPSTARTFSPRSIETRALRWAAGLVFLGWGLLHIFWDIPYRTYLWSETFFGWFVEGVLGWTWDSYVTSAEVDQGIQSLIRAIGIVLLAFSGLAFVLGRGFKRGRRLLALGSVPLALIALLYFKETSFQWAMLLEYTAQILAPTALALAFHSQYSQTRLPLLLKVAVATTFASHGLYALGYYSVPGHFIDMFIGVLRVDEASARMLLKLVGVLDLLLAVGLFFRPTQIAALTYATFWGVLTTLARPISYLEFSSDGFGNLAYWLTQALYRAPHFLLPMAALVVAVKMQNAGFRLRFQKIRTNSINELGKSPL